MASIAPIRVPLSVKSGLLLLCLTLLTTLSHAGHLHRHLRYRQLDAPTPNAASPADELSVEISNLQQSVATFGNGLRDYMATLSGRLSQVEKFLGANGGAVPAGSSSTPVVTATAVTTMSASLSASSQSTTSSSTMAIDTTTSTMTSTSTSAASTSLATTPDAPASSSASSSPTTPSASAASGAFDPHSTSNLAVYYGQTPGTAAEGLLPLCQDPRVNIVILAFVPTFFADGSQYPAVNFGPACHADPARAQTPGLLNCDTLGKQIAQCQAAHGTKVLVSLGGYTAQSAFTSDAQAAQFARTLWDLFGGGTGAAPGLRPFGPDVAVDGFDIDNEDHSTAHWPAFATALKALFAAAPQRTYYLSAAPQCPRPDASIPAPVLRLADFVWVQFYNNPACDLDAGQAFVESAAAWSADLGGSGPRFFVGMGAWPGAGKGFVDAGALAPIVHKAREAAAANFGGVMLWDGTVGAGNGYIAAAKNALTS